jgi:hypothetical protein
MWCPTVEHRVAVQLQQPEGARHVHDPQGKRARREEHAIMRTGRNRYASNVRRMSPSDNFLGAVRSSLIAPCDQDVDTARTDALLRSLRMAHDAIAGLRARNVVA